MQMYNDLPAEKKQQLKDEKFILWLVSEIPEPALAQIISLLDDKVKGKNPTKIPRKFYENHLKRLTERFLQSVIPLPSVILPLLATLPKEEKQALHTAMDSHQLPKETLTTLFTTTKKKEIPYSQQALLYVTNNYFDEAYELYTEHYKEEPPTPVVIKERKVPAKKDARNHEAERKNWQKQTAILKQTSEREQKKLTAQLAQLQTNYTQAQQKIAQLETTVTEQQQEMAIQHKQVQQLEKTLTIKEEVVQEPKSVAVREPKAVMLGYIEAYDPYHHENAIFINGSGELQFMIRPLSTPYAGFPLEEIETFTSWATDLAATTSFKDAGGTEEERCAHLSSFIEDKLLIFTAYKRNDANKKVHWVARNIQVISRHATFTPSDHYHMLPVFTEKITGASHIHALLKKLQARDFIGRIEHIATEPEDTPPILLYRTEANYYFVGRFTGHHYAYGGFKFDVTATTPLYYGEVPNALLTTCYAYRDVLFMEKHTYRTLQQALEQSSTVAVEAKNEPVITAQTYTEHIANEEAFIARWSKEIAATGLAYDEVDLANFHTCMKTGGLTIVAGMSGTGKSQLVQTYSRSLGLTKEQFLFIPVSPSWTDEADILGYYDVDHARFVPAATGMVDILQSAAQNRDKTYIICFDEMNLARIEHYFSPFLSLLELHQQGRELTLYHPKEGKDDARYPAQLPIGDNVLFVGTINLDESTHQLSDKALDRANLMTLRVLPFNDAFRTKTPVTLSRIKQPVALQQFVRTTEQITLREEQLTFLWEMHQHLQQANAYSGVGPRIVRQIDAYMKNSVTSGLSEAVAFDLQIVQRIISKIRGTHASIHRLVAQDGTLITLFNAYPTLSTFAEARQALANKEKELTQHGYAF